MSRDAIERLALARIVELSAELDVQFDKDARVRPMVLILGKAKEQAAIALRGLVYEDPNSADKIRELQHEVRRYDDLVAWCHELIIEGREADRHLAELDREELSQLVTSPEVQEERDALRGERTQED